jgi:hypothetical protein
VRVRDAVRVPMYGCDCYAYGLLAAGHTDLVVEADLKPYDYMALVPVITVSVCVFGGGGEIRFEKADCWAAAGLLLGRCCDAIEGGTIVCHHDHHPRRVCHRLQRQTFKCCCCYG